MNTFKAVWINPEGEVFYIEDCPEKVNVFNGHIQKDVELWDKIAEKEYQSAITKAKSKAVPFADQLWAKANLKGSLLCTQGNTKIEPDTFYPLPEGLIVEIREEPIQMGVLEALWDLNDPASIGLGGTGYGSTVKFMKLAYIKSSSEKPVESQEERKNDTRIVLASNIISFMAYVIAGICNGKREDLIELDFRNALDHFEELQKHFSITRK